MAESASAPIPSMKNVYARASYRFNLERDPKSRHDIQAAGATGPARPHLPEPRNVLHVWRNSLQRLPGAIDGQLTTILNESRALLPRRRRLQLQLPDVQRVRPLHVRARRRTMLPVDATGALIPLPLGSDSASGLAGFVRGIPATFSGGFVQADYLVLALGDGDHALGPGELFGRSYQRPDVRRRTHRISRLTIPAATVLRPGVQFLIHPNHQAFFRIPGPAAAVRDAGQSAERQSALPPTRSG